MIFADMAGFVGFKGVAKIAEEVGLGRESLYKVLSPRAYLS